MGCFTLRRGTPTPSHADGPLARAVNGDQNSVFKHGLSLALQAMGGLLDHDFSTPIEVASDFEFPNGLAPCGGVVHPPDAAACRAVRMLDVIRKLRVSLQIRPAREASPRLWEIELRQHLGKGRLALQLRKTSECAQGDFDVRRERVLQACEQEGLIVGREEHVLPILLEPFEDKLPIRERVGPEGGRAMEAMDEAGESADAEAVGITNLNLIAKRPQSGECLPSGKARSFGKEEGNGFLPEPGPGHRPRHTPLEDGVLVAKAFDQSGLLDQGDVHHIQPGRGRSRTFYADRTAGCHCKTGYPLGPDQQCACERSCTFEGSARS